jgi:hypothetical protein
MLGTHIFDYYFKFEPYRADILSYELFFPTPLFTNPEDPDYLVPSVHYCQGVDSTLDFLKTEFYQYVQALECDFGIVNYLQTSSTDLSTYCDYTTYNMSWMMKNKLYKAGSMKYNVMPWSCTSDYLADLPEYYAAKKAAAKYAEKKEEGKLKEKIEEKEE